MVAANHIAYTAFINPPGATPILTRAHIWPLLRRKVHSAQEFVPVISSTTVLSTTTNATGHPVTVREVTFLEGNRVVREECVEYEPMKIEFLQGDGSKVQDVVSEGSEGELYMTYTFEWLHPELAGDAEGLSEREAKEKKMAKMAVEGTIKTMREMVKDGRWEEKI